jgi:hypothetical protein
MPGLALCDFGGLKFDHDRRHRLVKTPLGILVCVALIDEPRFRIMISSGLYGSWRCASVTNLDFCLILHAKRDSFGYRDLLNLFRRPRLRRLPFLHNLT